MFEKINHFYHKQWKILFIIPLIFLVISSTVLVYNIVATGSPLQRGIDLTGGKRITLSIEGNIDLNQIEKIIPEANTRESGGINKVLLIETGPDADENDILLKLKNAGIEGEFSVEIVGPILSDMFWKQAQLALILAFILMAIVVFIIFRSFAPSMAVILCAITDITVSMFGMHLLGINLSLSTLAALLMLIGYSVDTDILLTTEVLKSNKPIEVSVNAAVKTGITMTLTSIAVFIVMYIIAPSVVLKEISSVVIIGLTVDVFATWLTNVGLLKMYVARKNKIKDDYK